MAGLICLLLPAASAARGLQILNVDESAFPTLRATVAIQDDRGAATCGLPLSEFRVTEDGVSASVGGVQWSGDSCERNLILVIDRSALTSFQNRLECAKDEANLLLDELDPGDSVTVIAYGGCSEVLVPRTNDIASAREAINGLTAMGRAAMADGIYHAIQEACAQGGGSVVWMGHGADTGSADCGFPPDGTDIDGLSDDGDLIRDLAAGCEITFNAVMSSTVNRGWIESLTNDLGGRVTVCGNSTTADRRAWLGSSPEDCCQAVLTFVSPRPDLDGSLRGLQICVDRYAVCGTGEYRAECSSQLRLTADTRNLLESGSCVIADSTTTIEVEGRICDDFTGLMHVNSSLGGSVAVPFLSLQNGYSAQMPSSLLVPNAVLDVYLDGILDGSSWREPTAGSYSLAVCSTDPNDSLAVSLGSVSIRPGAEGSIDLVISGGTLPYIASYEVDLRLATPGVSILSISQSGSVTEAASWLSPAWNELSPGIYRVSAAGASRIQSFGSLATLRIGVSSSSQPGCIPLEIVRVQLNDGVPDPLSVSGEVCIQEGCFEGQVVHWSGTQEGLEGVSVLRVGDGIPITRSGADGRYEICDNVESGDRLFFESETSARPRVTPLDASDVLRATVGLDDLQSVELTGPCGPSYPRELAADVSGDGEIGAYDASLILQYVVQSIQGFPVDEWTFVCPTKLVESSRSLGVTYGIAAGDVNGNSGASDPLLRTPQPPQAAKLRFDLGDDGIRTLRALGPEVRAGMLTLELDDVDVDIEAQPGIVVAESRNGGTVTIAFACSGRSDGEALLSIRGGHFSVVEGSVVVNDHASVVESEGVWAGSKMPSRIFLRVRSLSEGVEFSWATSAAAQSKIRIYDSRGRRVHEVHLSSAEGSLRWRGVDQRGVSLARGVYFAALHTGSKAELVRKFILSPKP